ncbi:SIR2 family NAD-dependent protein deacylase [Xanthomonas citri]|uniref:SIR2 family NAD-dependent protein deacylase n=1 Tax=Xanthomonas citri TaxID=346 RepID=UPI000C43A71B|nr:SIR2 family protein [Xanthomonas citri]SOO14211.1 conserved hypothetical protein [Xanthomonas citri pv. fuscans]
MSQKDATNGKVSELQDYAALKKLAAALWQEDSAYHGAAVLVGAGFSRCGGRSGDADARLPLWHDLSRALANELKTSSGSDPLRLAEEYCAYFGRQALYDLVTKEVNDPSWTPGNLHEVLLELPWSEVLTTNWDTLLERASREVHQPSYSLVSKQQDLSSVRSPRIVKLHGTINVSDDLIFTSEDYRRYPQKYAAFVNFARQVFIENELCLVGFSGEDPNFLQWAGWVRDHLAANSRRIYLAGALNLTAAKRKYLESINVAPIDLGALVDDYDDPDEKHAVATEIFLRTLLDLRPKPAWEWRPRSLHRQTLSTAEKASERAEPERYASDIEQQVLILEEDRESYPGWLICPEGLRWELQNQSVDPHPNPRSLAAMGRDVRARLLYEIAWRQRVTLQAMPVWLVKAFLEICDPSQPCALTKKQQMEMSLLILKNTRWCDDEENGDISQKMADILQGNKKYWSESENEVHYHQALVARDSFQFEVLEKLVEKIEESDSVWKIRKASLLAELGSFERGERLVAEGYKQLLGQSRTEPSSIYITSRLAYADWLLRGIRALRPGRLQGAFPAKYESAYCSPVSHLDTLKSDLQKEIERQEGSKRIEPLFEPGRYKDRSKDVTFNNTLHPLLLMDAISGVGGLPLRWRHSSFMADLAAKMAQLDSVDNAQKHALAIRSASHDRADVLKATFSRTAVAGLHPDYVQGLVKQCCEAIDYWRVRLASGETHLRGYAMERLRVFCEVLARLSVRLLPQEAKRIFRLGIELGSNPQFRHVWLISSLRSLISNALESVPTSEQSELLLDALSFPLSRELGLGRSEQWPNPFVECPGQRTENFAIDRRIGEIIDAIEPCSPDSAEPLLRLLPLLETNFLTKGERDRISSIVWRGERDVLPELGLFKYVCLLLPGGDADRVKSMVRHYLFEASGEQLLNSSRLNDIANAAHAKSVVETPSEAQADDYFQKLVGWRKPTNDEYAESFFGSTDSQLGEDIGRALSLSVVPAMGARSLSEENFSLLESFHTEVGSKEAIVAFSYFAAKNSGFAVRVEALIGRQMREKSGNGPACASHAILCWRSASSGPEVERLVSRLIVQLSVNQSACAPALVWTARELYKGGYLIDHDAAVLLEAVPVIFEASEYHSVSPTSREAAVVSLVKAACVRVAAEAVAKGQDPDGCLQRVLDQAKLDALPEVRFADRSGGG